MGRFDALTHLEEQQTPERQPDTAPVAQPVSHSPAPVKQEPPGGKSPAPPIGENSPVLPSLTPHAAKKQRASGKKSVPQQPSKSINALQLKTDKFDKYSTYLRPG
jgi:hypothetical protein